MHDSGAAVGIACVRACVHYRMLFGERRRVLLSQCNLVTEILPHHVDLCKPQQGCAAHDVNGAASRLNAHPHSCGRVDGSVQRVGRQDGVGGIQSATRHDGARRTPGARPRARWRNGMRFGARGAGAQDERVGCSVPGRSRCQSRSEYQLQPKRRFVRSASPPAPSRRIRDHAMRPWTEPSARAADRRRAGCARVSGRE